MSLRAVAAATALACAVLAAACGGGSQPASTAPTATPPAAITVSSPAFQPGGAIPPQFTCSGQNLSPPLSWSGIPPNATQLAVGIQDLDAGGFVHWVVFGFDARITGLGTALVPPSAQQGRNGFGTVGYGGPCPPPGGAHHYAVTVYALQRPPGLQNAVDGKSALAAIGQAAIARGSVVFTFAR